MAGAWRDGKDGRHRSKGKEGYGWVGLGWVETGGCWGEALSMKQ